MVGWEKGGKSITGDFRGVRHKTVRLSNSNIRCVRLTTRAQGMGCPGTYVS